MKQFLEFYIIFPSGEKKTFCVEEGSTGEDMLHTVLSEKRLCASAQETMIAIGDLSSFLDDNEGIDLRHSWEGARLAQSQSRMSRRGKSITEFVRQMVVQMEKFGATRDDFQNGVWPTGSLQCLKPLIPDDVIDALRYKEKFTSSTSWRNAMSNSTPTIVHDEIQLGVPPMSQKPVVKQTLVFGRNIENYGDQETVALIKETNAKIKSIKDLGIDSANLRNQIAELEEAKALLVTHLDRNVPSSDDSAE